MPPRETGLLSDVPPPPAPAMAPPSTDLALATQLAQAAEQRAVAHYKSLVAGYYSAILKMANGGQPDADETARFQRALHLLRKSPQAIEQDLREARRILAAKAWLTSHSESDTRREIGIVAQKIAGYDGEIRDAISRVRSKAAPAHARLAELQRLEFSFPTNQAQARGWDHYIEGRFEPDPQVLDRIRGAM